MADNTKLNANLTIQVVMFSYTEKVTKDSAIFQFLFDIMNLVALNHKWKMGQIVVAFLEYLNFNFLLKLKSHQILDTYMEDAPWS